ncbi:radical SAM protein [Neptunomonas qingdaonensis]|uniref:4Fe-4S single cluster domain-containing protein n=1 Tax=Neptunomonas qingdaonensis TaxID=1045558 RepID=A0A1I2TN37_9GAMM|nr:radical SAM protein [Neptunomonas qingdaonensis]SFG66330.1 4Fe-4S single cluster domain-containing protein [Neptunomonas qingdaonensis]
MRKYKFLRSRHKIEIDITWQCNLKCFDCNRCCGTSPTGERMSVDQIERFIAESNLNSYKWKIIRLVGGEPTLHPDFPTIVRLLLTYRDSFYEKDKPKIIVCTNGYSNKTKKILSELPCEIIIDNSNKSSENVAHIGHFNMAPIDIRDTSKDDFTLACTNTTYCGMGLTPNGYYHCPVAGSIDRIFGKNLGYKKLPEQVDEMDNLKQEFCKLCGFYDMDDTKVVPSIDNIKLLDSQPTISSSWKQALRDIKIQGRHKLTRY